MIELLKQNIAGLESRIATMEAQQQLFLKVQGIDETIEKSKVEAVDLEKETEELKTAIADLKQKKRESLAATMDALALKMSEVMPIGKAVFDISEDGKVFIGLETNIGVVPHAGLSGGQKSAFDQALAYALLGNGEKVIVIEAAEMDRKRLEMTLDAIEVNADDKTQYIVNTWVDLKTTITDKWNIVRL